jgi:hypothetical protein
VPAALELGLGYRHWLTRSLALDALALLPTFGSRVEGPEGSARISVGMFGAGVAYGSARDARVRVSAGAGVLALALRAEGAARAPDLSRDDVVWAAAPYLRSGLTVGLTGRLAARADLLGGVALPRPVVRFAGHEVARFGQPFVAGVLSAEVEVF